MAENEVEAIVDASAAGAGENDAPGGEMSLDEARALLAAQELAESAGDAAGADGGPEGGIGDEAAAGNDDEKPAPVDAQEAADGGQAVEAAESERAYVEGSVGLGVDIVEVERMAAILKRNPAFATRVFSQAEQDYCNGKANPATHYALRFAAKEAVVKALGTGFSQGIGVRDVEVERNASGKPYAKLTGRALEVAEEQGVRELSISLSYTHTDAVACAMAVTNASVRESEKRKDPAAELARLFKETRGMLDEL